MRSSPDYLEVDFILEHQLVRGRGFLAVLYNTHRPDLSISSWEREADLDRHRRIILLYWSGDVCQRIHGNRSPNVVLVHVRCIASLPDREEPGTSTTATPLSPTMFGRAAFRLHRSPSTLASGTKPKMVFGGRENFLRDRATPTSSASRMTPDPSDLPSPLRRTPPP